MPRKDVKEFLLYQATVTIHAPISTPDSVTEQVADELDELNDLLDNAARTFLDMRRSKWRKLRLRLQVR